jgi:hypothetical protein
MRAFTCLVGDLPHHHPSRSFPAQCKSLDGLPRPYVPTSDCKECVQARLRYTARLSSSICLSVSTDFHPVARAGVAAAGVFGVF